MIHSLVCCAVAHDTITSRSPRAVWTPPQILTPSVLLSSQISLCGCNPSHEGQWCAYIILKHHSCQLYLRPIIHVLLCVWLK